MKPKFIKIVNNPDASFHVARFTDKHFAVPWHFHPELELNYIIKSTGTRFVGDNIDRFSPGELTLVGSGLPHLWKNDSDYYLPGSKKSVDAIVIRFSSENMGLNRTDMPEMEDVLKLLQLAKRGMIINGPVKDAVTHRMNSLLLESGLQRYISLLTILDLISHNRNYGLLSSEGFMPGTRAEDAQRINVVCDYIFKNFRNDIALKKVADIVFMNASSFSRYFKQHTGKSFSDFIIEIRIGNACKMLIETEESVTGILYECGFRNQSNFNSFFKRKAKMTPLEYRRKHR